MLENRETANGLDAVLTRHLQSVAAPHELWQRIQQGKAPRRTNSSLGFKFAVVAAVFCLAPVFCVAWLGWGFRLTHGLERDKTSAGLEAARILDEAPENMEFRSADPAKIRSWVKQNCGLDVPFPAGPSSAVRLIGAHIVNTQTPSAAVAYQVGGRYAVLVVSKSPAGLENGVGHRSLGVQRSNDARTSSWTMRGQSYLLASTVAGDFRAACLVCHNGAERLGILN